MTKKTATITLEYHPSGINVLDGKENFYRVVQVTDSVDHNPGDLLTKQQAKDLCAAPAWKVTIKRPVR